MIALMSERTAEALAKIDVLIPLIRALPLNADTAKLTEEAEALRRAVAAFHLEAIRFRMFNVDRQIKHTGDEGGMRQAFEAVRDALEKAGFHTRSHTAP